MSVRKLPQPQKMILANNPISGMLIAGTFIVISPGMVFLSLCTGLVGLLLSVLINDPPNNIVNGLTLFNPLLIGAVTYNLIPRFFEIWDGYLLLLLFLFTIFSVYLTRVLSRGKLPHLSAPFNIVQLTFLSTLSLHQSFNTATDISSINSTVTRIANGAAMGEEDIRFAENATIDELNWGMVFRGIVASSSQVFAVDDVAAASIIYLAILIYSPVMTGFSFAGASLGTLTGLGLGNSYQEVYSGLWGYNSLLTGAVLGGNFMILNGQTTTTALFATLITAIFQNLVNSVFNKPDDEREVEEERSPVYPP